MEIEVKFRKAFLDLEVVGYNCVFSPEEYERVLEKDGLYMTVMKGLKEGSGSPSLNLIEFYNNRITFKPYIFHISNLTYYNAQKLFNYFETDFMKRRPSFYTQYQVEINYIIKIMMNFILTEPCIREKKYQHLFKIQEIMLGSACL